MVLLCDYTDSLLRNRNVECNKKSPYRTCLLKRNRDRGKDSGRMVTLIEVTVASIIY